MKNKIKPVAKIYYKGDNDKMLKNLLKKDIKIFMFLLILPIIVPTALCSIFGNIYVQDIPMGIVDNDNSFLSRKISTGFETHPGFQVYYVDSEADLQKSIKSKELSCGIVIPQNFNQDLSSRNPSKIIAFIDGTNLLIGNNARGYISAVLSTYNAGIELNYLEEKGMLPQEAVKVINTFNYVDRTLYDPYLSYLCYMIYIIVPYLIQMFFVCYFAIPILSQERVVFLQIKENGREFYKAYTCERIKAIFPRFLFIGVSSSIASYIGLLIAAKFFGLPMRGNVLCYFVLMATFILAISASSLFVSTFIKPRNTLYFAEFYTIISVVIIITSGATWPTFLMPKGFYSIVKIIWPYAILANPFKLLNLKGSGWGIIMPYIWQGLLFSIFWVVISVIVIILQKRRQFRVNKYIS
nr:ABC transporter permease [uncultured Aminipila sp.]